MEKTIMEMTDEQIQELIEKAESGDSQTQYKLGKYYWGDGFIRDREKAERWFLKAAEQGLAEAQYSLGVLYNHAILFKKSFDEKAQTWGKIEYWWLKAAEQDNTYAQYMLGVNYDNSNKDYHSVIIKDDEKAVCYFTKAAGKGHANAQLDLGSCYMDGRGVEKDWEKAKFWFGKAAEQKNKAALYKKALCEHERVIVYLDYDEFPNVDFLTNRGIMYKCEKLLGENYKVIYVWGHMNDYDGMCNVIHGSLVNMSPYIVLYKNGIEVVRSAETYKNSYSDLGKEKYVAPSEKLADWIREKLK
jgi:hypothetical protein